MTDVTTNLADSAKKAGPGDKTDEQIWTEINAEEAEAPPTDDDAPPTDDEVGDGTDDVDEPDRDADGDDDQDTSKVAGGAKRNSGKDDAGDDPKVLKEQRDRLQHAFDSQKGRLSAQDRELDRLRAELAAARAKPARTATDEDTLRQRKEKLDRAQEEYGDVIGPVVEQITELESRLEALSAQEARQLDAQRDRYARLVEAEEAAFLAEHPDGFDLITQNRDAFNAWIEDQPKVDRDIFTANKEEITNGTAAALLISKFKQAIHAGEGSAPADNTETDKLRSKRERQLSGARSPRTPPRQATSGGPPPEGASDEAHWEYWENRDRQKAASR